MIYTDFLSGYAVIGQVEMASNRKRYCPEKGQIYVRYKEEIFHYESDKEQVAQRGGKCPMPGNIQGQVKWSSEQPDLP